MGETTAIASVVPAARPAKGLYEGENSHRLQCWWYEVLTKKYSSGANLAIGICHPWLVQLKGTETDSHLWHDTGDNCTQTFVKSPKRLIPYNLGTNTKEAEFLGLYVYIHSMNKRSAVGLTTIIITPWFLLNCILTLTVSSGWQVHASINPALPPATRWVRREVGFLLSRLMILVENGKKRWSQQDVNTTLLYRAIILGK